MNKKSIVAGSIVVIFLVVFLWSVSQKHEEAKSEDEVAMAELEKIIVLPEGVPSIATVTDREKLGDQPFFAKAENGDKVIIYVEAKRAYLYRPSQKKIIDMTVVSEEETEANTSLTPENTPVFQVNEAQ